MLLRVKLLYLKMPISWQIPRSNQVSSIVRDQFVKVQWERLLQQIFPGMAQGHLMATHLVQVHLIDSQKYLQ